MDHIEGIMKDTVDFHHGFHSHSWHQLIYAIHGSVTVECLGKYFIAPQNRAVWIPSEHIHKTYSTSRAIFRSLLINPQPHMQRSLQKQPSVLCVSHLFKQLIIKFCEDSFVTTDYFEHAEQLLLDEIIYAKSISINSSIPEDPKLYSLCQQLIQNPEQRMSIVQASEVLHMGRSSFIRYFKKQTGMTFGQWYQQLKISQSISMLTSGKTLQEVAFSCGYQSASSFCAMFKRTIGCTPTEYLQDNTH
ncbi:AraC family transcriptional regulator [Celerinatantimonas diazotrophica]|uniref:AraC family transcriptional regulator n=1 Tax=Celerinatantimonas diazotrophica TaxID=412034 RepID=A0A4R1K2K0_9GAMM|nr:helix-turn-helix transcriptional regulator [Celerinatantimonas diazotrophica]TCK58067.1 AraC family transcriptional regulator [Celerinatantimonas diazotrophica]CAG9297864.1 HTH-type transcriptional regulator NimR [Celerinatantimonas diazotrophica]